MDLVNIDALSKRKDNALSISDNPLSTSVFIQELKPPKQEMSFNRSKNGNYFNSSFGYVQLDDGSRVHPLQVIAGLTNSKVADMPSDLIKHREPLVLGEEAFQPFMVIDKKNEYVAISSGQHNRNSSENIIIKYPVKYVAEISKTDGLIRLYDDVYTDRQATQIIVKKDFNSKYMPPELVENIPLFLEVQENLIMKGEICYFKGDTREMTVPDMVVVLQNMGTDFMGYWDENEAWRKYPSRCLVGLAKWFKENVPAIGKVEHRYNYLTVENMGVSKGREYHITGRLESGFKPDALKPHNYEEIINWFKTNRLPEVDALIYSGVASGFEVPWSGAKEYLNIINAVSNFAKTQLVIEPLKMCGLATSMKSTDLVGLAGLGGSRISGADPIQLAQYPFCCFDEVATKDKKVDEMFMDLMKEFTFGMPLRTLKSSNVNVRGHIAILMSRTEHGELSQAHDEYLSRMNKLQIGKNTEFEKSNAPASLNECKNALAHYYYETFTLILEKFEVMTSSERISWCNENIVFHYLSEREQAKKDSRLLPYDVVLSMVKDGAEQMLNIGINPNISSKDKYPIGTSMGSMTTRDRADIFVEGSRGGQVVVRSKNGIYKYLTYGDGLQKGQKDDIEKALTRLFTYKADQRLKSYRPLETSANTNCYRGLQLDVDELFTDGIEGVISEMTSVDIAELLENTNYSLPNSKAWSKIAKRLIELDVTQQYAVVEEEGENPWND